MPHSLPDIRRQHIAALRYTLATLDHIITMTPQTDATTFRDSGDGWTVLEVLGHLMDFDQIFYDRAVMIRDEDNPTLPAFDHDALVEQGKFNARAKADVYATLRQSRLQFIDFFDALTDEQWARTGIHPERGPFSLTDALLQVVMHDTNHIEQITRILAEQQLPAS